MLAFWPKAGHEQTSANNKILFIEYMTHVHRESAPQGNPNCYWALSTVLA